MNNISVTESEIPILPAEVIPPNSIVTKLNGNNRTDIRPKEYQLVKHINVWFDGKIVNQTGQLTVPISSDDNTKFILQTDGNANVVTNDTNLIWKTNVDTLFQFLGR